jgi:hypothetical protein
LKEIGHGSFGAVYYVSLGKWQSRRYLLFIFIIITLIYKLILTGKILEVLAPSKTALVLCCHPQLFYFAVGQTCQDRGGGRHQENVIQWQAKCWEMGRHC